MTGRLLIASLVSSVASVATFCLVLFGLIGGATGWAGLGASNFGSGLFFAFFFGWPIAFLLTAGIGIALYRRLAGSDGRVAFRVVIAHAMLACSLVVSLASFLAAGSVDGLAIAAGLGAAAGFAGGSCFWFIACPRKPT